MPVTERFDHLLLGATVVQTAVGLALLASSSWLLATERYHRAGLYFTSWQAATAVVGLVLLVALMHLRLRLIEGSTVPRCALALTWVLLALCQLQPEVAGSHRWLSVFGLSFQPSVLARLALVVVAATELAAAQREQWRPRRLALLGLASGVTILLIGIEPDIGSAAVLALVLGVMAYVAGMPLRLLWPPAAAALLVLAIAVSAFPHARGRVFAFLNPDNGSAAAFQSQQSLIAVGSGGALGKGYGQSLQKLFFLPEPHTDFIYSITVEELGLLGMAVLVCLPALITWRGLRVAAGQKEAQLGLLAFGLTFAYAMQTLVHVAVAVRWLPPKGIPLPLVSYGKTDLLVTLASVGLLLNLSREVGR